MARINSFKVKFYLKGKMLLFNDESQYIKFLELCTKLKIVWQTGGFDIAACKKYYLDRMFLIFNKEEEIRSYGSLRVLDTVRLEKYNHGPFETVKYEDLKEYIKTKCMIN